jgi:hypothetical protein
MLLTVADVYIHTWKDTPLVLQFDELNFETELCTELFFLL